MGRGTSKANGGSTGGARVADNTNYMGMTEAEWEANNARIEAEFNQWLDSNQQGAFEADEYNIFERMTLDEVRRYMTPDSQNSSRAYYSQDWVPEDDSWAILYNDGSIVALGEGDDLAGVRRSGIRAAIYSNPSSYMVYGRSSDFRIYNDSDFSDNNDIWRIDFDV